MDDSGSPAQHDEGRAAMAGVARGDRAALARLMAQFAPGLLRFARQNLSQPADAEDAVQECFLRAWRAAASYDPARAAVSTWLYRILLRLCIDRNRRTGLRRFLGLETAPEPMDDTPDAETDLAGRQELRRTQAAMRHLPDRQRQALLLRAVAGQTTTEIAATLGISPGAAEQLLVRARAALRARLEDRNDRGSRQR